MNREETLALYKQGVDAWNKWANEMLEERKRLEEAGEWKVYKSFVDSMCPSNELTRQWLVNASADFSNKESPHIFYKPVDFSNYIFPADVDFSMAKFKNFADFNKTTFYNFVNFENCRFMSWVNFDHSVFYEPAFFNRIKCYKHNSFDHIKCYSFFDCNEAKFKKITSFENSKFMLSTTFKNTIFLDITSFSGSHFSGYSSFFETKFNKVVFFTAISSKNYFTLENSFFKNHAPNFIQASFKEAPQLNNIKFGPNVLPGKFINSITNFTHPEIKANYQALKRLAIQAHDHENEQRFWAGELRSDRSLRTENAGWNLRPLISAFWWGNIAYEFLSNFGRSIVRPLAYLIALALIMTGIHIYTHHTLNKEPTSNLRTKTHITKQSDLKDCNIRSSAFRVAAKNGAIGLLQNPAKRSTFVRDYTCLYGTYNDNVTPKVPNSIFWIELFHTLFSAILIFLTLLGIRNNFKLK